MLFFPDVLWIDRGKIGNHTYSRSDAGACCSSRTNSGETNADVWGVTHSSLRTMDGNASSGSYERHASRHTEEAS